MSVYSLCLQAILLFPNIYVQAEVTDNATKNINITRKQDETVFTDVIQNISRVNSALQELIHNYEQIQKFYEINSFEKEYSSDTEIDEVYKKHKKKKNPRSKNVHQIEPIMSNFAATKMIVSEEEESETEDSDEGETLSSTTPITKEVSKAVKNQLLPLSEDKTVGNVIEEKYPVLLENSSEDDNNTLTSKTPTKFPLQPEIVDLNEDEVTASSKHHRKLKKDTVPYDETMPTTQDRPLRNVAKIIYAETFPRGQIWNSIAQKKPIKLRTLHIPPQSQVEKIHFRSRPKTALVIVAKNNKNLGDPVEIPMSLEHVFSSDSEDLNSKIIQANILRDDYGQACMRMVVKKCYRACKETIKLSCKVTSCKSSFIEKFQEKSKTGCIQEFRPAEATTSEAPAQKRNKKIVKKGKNRADDDNDDSDDDLLDITRSGFPAEACYPFMFQGAKTEKKSSNLTIEPLKQVLRDRYERLCAKASADKCNNACLYAYKQTCEVYECANSKKKPFRRHCRKQCKKAYKSSKKDSSDSSSSSSESGSDSITDFDTEDFER